MGCSNCGDRTKPSRHRPVTLVAGGDVDSKGSPETPVVPTSSVTTIPAPDPSKPDAAQAGFEAAQKMSYEEIMNRQNALQEAMDQQAEAAFQQMTVDMKKFHVLSLVSAANYETANLSNMAPDHAVVVLKKTLDRDDFAEIREFFPGLQEQVNKRYDKLLQDRITI